MVSDSTTTIRDLKEALRKFRDAREWGRFHDPKNLAEAISIEASELMELFLWKNPKVVANAMKRDRSFRQTGERELADIVCFSLSFANSTGIDVSEAVLSKIEMNEKKYPVRKAKGVATKYNRL
jgi:dCTP diphosphatase